MAVPDRLPKLFIGSSSESLPVVNIVKEALKDQASITLWTDRSVFRPLDFYVESLLRVPELFDFGLFMFEPDDVVMSRGTTNSAPRDNVIFELGLFMSRLGLKRAFAMMPRGGVRILSDISGLKLVEYDDPPGAAELRVKMVKNFKKPRAYKTLVDAFQTLLRPALEPAIGDLRELLEPGSIEATGVFAEAGNVVQIAPTVLRLVNAALDISGAAVVRHLALDMSEAWGILANEVLRGKPTNVTWKCLMIDPESPAIQAVASPTVSVDVARTRLPQMRAFLDEHAGDMAGRNVSFECKLYSEPPTTHGFHIDGTALLWSMCDIVGGKLEASNTPYWRFEVADPAVFSSHPARSFKNWFDHGWEHARPAWPPK